MKQLIAVLAIGYKEADDDGYYLHPRQLLGNGDLIAKTTKGEMRSVLTLQQIEDFTARRKNTTSHSEAVLYDYLRDYVALCAATNSRGAKRIGQGLHKILQRLGKHEPPQ